MRFLTIIILSTSVLFQDIAVVHGAWATSFARVGAHYLEFIGTINDLYSSKNNDNSPYQQFQSYLQTKTAYVNENSAQLMEGDDDLEQEITDDAETNIGNQINTCISGIKEKKQTLVKAKNTQSVDALTNDLRTAIIDLCGNINRDNAIETYHQHSSIMLIEKLQEIYTDVADGTDDMFTSECT